MRRNANGRPLLVLILALALVPAFATGALANNQPTELGLSLFLLQVFLLIGLTAAGGGYLVMRRLNESKYPSRAKRTGRALLEGVAGAVAFFCGMLLPPLTLPILGLYAVARGVSLWRWGRAAVKVEPRPTHLEGLPPWRLRWAGGLLIALTLLTCAYSLLNYNDMVGMDDYRRRAYVSMLNSDARHAYDAARLYLEEHPQARVAPCAELAAYGYAPTYPELTCVSDLSATAGSIRIGGPERWHLGVPVASVDAAGTLTPAER